VLLPVPRVPPVGAPKYRVALVTGGGSGIGRATALRLATEGTIVAVAGRREAPLAETVALIEQAGGRGLAVPGDQAVAEDATQIVATTLAELARLDVLVNNAGEIRRGLRLHEVPVERWDAQLASNLHGVYLVTRAALPHLLAGDGDRAIVNVASTLAHTAAPGVAPYAAAKGGVIALTRALAVEYAVEGIRCNCVCPGIVDTPLAYVDRPRFEEQKHAFAREYPLGRVGSAEDVAAAIAFLASPDASWVTRSILNVDGGFTAR